MGAYRDQTNGDRPDIDPHAGPWAVACPALPCLALCMPGWPLSLEWHSTNGVTCVYRSLLFSVLLCCPAIRMSLPSERVHECRRAAWRACPLLRPSFSPHYGFVCFPWRFFRPLPRSFRTMPGVFALSHACPLSTATKDTPPAVSDSRSLRPRERVLRDCARNALFGHMPSNCPQFYSPPHSVICPITLGRVPGQIQASVIRILPLFIPRKISVFNKSTHNNVVCHLLLFFGRAGPYESWIQPW